MAAVRLCTAGSKQQAVVGGDSVGEQQSAGCCLPSAGYLLAWSMLTIGLALARQTPLVADTPLPLRPNRCKATTSLAARNDAVRSIPLKQLDADARAKVTTVLSGARIFRRLPIAVVQCDPELYLFLVEHPDVVVNIWQALGITQLAMQQIGPDAFRVTDNAGTVGTIQFLHCTHDTHLIYTEGSYDGPLFTKPVQGRGLVILKTGYVREPDGRYYITSRLDTFMDLDRTGVEVLTKTFQPLVGRVADINFIQTVAFLGSLSRTAEVNLRGVSRLAGKLSRVQPEVRDQFAKMAQRVAQKAAEPSDRRDTVDIKVAERPGETGTQ